MEEYNNYLKTIGEYGVISEVKHPVVTVIGLPHAKVDELVLFENGQMGQVFSIEQDSVKVLVFSRQPLRVGLPLVRTDKYLKIPVGLQLLGSVMDPIGNVISPGPHYQKPTEERDVKGIVPPIFQRSRIKQPFKTGLTLVDFLIPLGKGQKELIIGDRKTGKSSFFTTSVKVQVEQNVIVIYGIIGKNKSDSKKIVEYYRQTGLAKNMIFVLSNSDDSPSLIYVTPYTAMAIAEFFRDAGQDVMVILDDLSTHATYYREIMLISGGFPGRESYPGDIFYIHARLLEKAGNFIHANGKEVSITAFPVVETVEGDLTGYIPTNVMGMTDGHIFFDSNAYYNGRRPAIDVGLSVTRVGRQTQSDLKREINKEVVKFLNEYDRLQNYSHFGAELSQKVKDTLRKGDLLYEMFNQHYSVVIPEELQIILFGLIWLNIIDRDKTLTLQKVRTQLLKNYNDQNIRKLFNAIVQAKSMYELLTNISRAEQQLALLWKTENK